MIKYILFLFFLLFNLSAISQTIGETDENRFTNQVKLQGLNKITAKNSEIIISEDGDVVFENIIISMEKCWKSLPTEKPENKALLKIYDYKNKEKGELIFYGWIFSSSPSISGLEHPLYDITLLECFN